MEEDEVVILEPELLGDLDRGSAPAADGWALRLSVHDGEVLGRAQINPGSRHLSRKHIVARRVHRQAQIKGIGRAGTWLNGERIPEDSWRPLSPGDRVSLCSPGSAEFPAYVWCLPPQRPGVKRPRSAATGAGVEDAIVIEDGTVGAPAVVVLDSSQEEPVWSSDPDEDADRELALQLQSELNRGDEKKTDDPAAMSDSEYAKKLQEEFDRMDRASYAEIQERNKNDPGRDVLYEHRASIDRILKNQLNCPQVQIKKVTPNVHSLPGTTLYERFLESWCDVPDKTVRVVFHGTAEANIDAICRDSLDPGKRTGQAMGKGEYFGLDFLTSLGYCKGGKKMLVFAVLADKSGLTCLQENSAAGRPWQAGRRGMSGYTLGQGVSEPGKSDVLETGRKTSGVIVINKKEHQLPLFIVEFEMRGSPYGHLHGAGASMYGAGAAMYGAGSAMYGAGAAAAAAAMRLAGGMPGFGMGPGYTLGAAQPPLRPPVNFYPQPKRRKRSALVRVKQPVVEQPESFPGGLSVGCKVRIHGLNDRPSLNQQMVLATVWPQPDLCLQGTVLGYNASRLRFNIKCDRIPQISIKLANLTLLSDAEVAKAEDAAAEKFFLLLTLAHEMYRSQAFDHATLTSILQQLFSESHSGSHSPTAAVPAPVASKHCTVCFTEWGTDAVAAALPVNCGGSKMICQSCLLQWVTSQIDAGDVIPWIATPAPQNSSPLPLETLLDAGVDDRTLCKFAVEHLRRVLPRYSAFVQCSNTKCQFGFLVTGDKDQRRQCEACKTMQTVSRNPLSRDPALQKMLKDGTVRLCPRCMPFLLV